MPKYMAKMNPIIIIQKLNEAKTDKAKVKIIKNAWSTNSEEFFVGLQLSVDNHDFKIKSAPEIQDTDDGSIGDLTFPQFYSLAIKLSTENLSSDEIRNLITDAAMKANVTEWNLWYRKILLKSLHKNLPMEVIIKTLAQLTGA